MKKFFYYPRRAYRSDLGFGRLFYEPRFNVWDEPWLRVE